MENPATESARLANWLQAWTVPSAQGRKHRCNEVNATRAASLRGSGALLGSTLGRPKTALVDLRDWLETLTP
jgi:hypothetical protein